MDYETLFGNTLQKLRLEQNLSQLELSKISKIDRTFISLMERGIRQPSLTTIIRLAAGLKMKPSLLIVEFETSLRRSRWKRLKK